MQRIYKLTVEFDDEMDVAELQNQFMNEIWHLSDIGIAIKYAKDITEEASGESTVVAAPSRS